MQTIDDNEVENYEFTQDELNLIRISSFSNDRDVNKIKRQIIREKQDNVGKKLTEIQLLYSKQTCPPRNVYKLIFS